LVADGNFFDEDSWIPSPDPPRAFWIRLDCNDPGAEFDEHIGSAAHMRSDVEDKITWTYNGAIQLEHGCALARPMRRTYTLKDTVNWPVYSGFEEKRLQTTCQHASVLTT